MTKIAQVVEEPVTHLTASLGEIARTADKTTQKAAGKSADFLENLEAKYAFYLPLARKFATKYYKFGFKLVKKYPFQSFALVGAVTGLSLFLRHRRREEAANAL